MKRLLIFLFCNSFLSAVCIAQSTSQVKIGIGPKILFSPNDQNIMVPALEGEYTKNLNRFFSASGTAGIGLGKRESMVSDEIQHHALITNLDGNIFLSPFGNDKKYNLKLGSGVSVMHVSEKFSGSGISNTQWATRLRSGLSVILENEFAIGEKSLFGIKAMVQPYVMQDVAASLLFKYGIRI